jgi:predicted small metal-binding protein
MAKVLKCGDLMPGCNAVIEGKDEAEVMAKGTEHAKTAHKMTAIPPDMAAKRASMNNMCNVRLAGSGSG